MVPELADGEGVFRWLHEFQLECFKMDKDERNVPACATSWLALKDIEDHLREIRIKRLLVPV